MDWSKCPYCGSEDTTADDYDFSGDEVYWDVSCGDCGKQWFEVYKQRYRVDENGEELK